MDNFRKALYSMGLSSEEITIYLASLAEGTTTALSLARSSGIPRTTVYLLLDSLMQKGLITQTADGVKKAFIPASPEELMTLAQKKKDEMQAAITSLRFELPQLEAVYNQSHRKPRITYHEGAVEVKKIYEDSLTAGEIYFHHMSAMGRELMGDYGEYYWSQIMQKMIHTKQILTDSETNKQYIQDQSSQRNQMVCISSRYMTSTDYFIYGQKVAFITYKDQQPIGILIDDAEISHFERVRYILLWDSLYTQNNVR